jgi:hypothetical protein
MIDCQQNNSCDPINNQITKIFVKEPGISASRNPYESLYKEPYGIYKNVVPRNTKFLYKDSYRKTPYTPLPEHKTSKRYTNSMKDLKRYYYNNYLPTDTDINNARVTHQVKYGTDKIGKGYYNNNMIPYNHVEYNGKLYNCDLQDRKPNVLCTDDIYSNEIMAKCEAQSKFLGRTKGGHCSLDGSVSPHIPMIKNNYLIHDIEDASRHGLLDNSQVYVKKKGKITRKDTLTSQDYWKNNSYNPVYNVRWNAIDYKPNRRY